MNVMRIAWVAGLVVATACTVNGFIPWGSGDVEVSTNVGTSVIVDPVAANHRTIYLDIRSGVPEFNRKNFSDFVKQQFEVRNEKRYHIMDDPTRAQFTMIVVARNFQKATAGSNPGSPSVNVYTLYCDVQIKELIEVQGTSEFDVRAIRKEYQTNIVTTAKGVRLDPPKAQDEIFKRTAAAMAGFF